MAVLAGLSGAHAILLASHLCASGQVAALPRLQAQFPGYLPLERVLRLLLTFLPESIEPQYYTPVLQELVDTFSSLSELSEDYIDLSPVKDLSEAAARKRVRKLRLLPLKYRDDDDSDDTTDLLTQFLIHRAHRIDAETSLQPFILELLLPFYERSPVLCTWFISSLIPLLRLNYEYYPDQDGTFSLDVIESLDDQTAVNVLLSMTGSHSDNMDLVKNLRGLIGPWIHGSNRSKRRRLNEAAQRGSATVTQGPYRPRTASHAAWGPVNEWLLSRSLVDLKSVVGAYTDWKGPQDVDLGGYGDANGQYQGDELADLQARHGQSGLAVVYANSDTSGQTLEGCVQIVTRTAQQLGLEGSLPDSPLSTVTYDTNTISSTSRASLLQNALLVSSNSLTRPSATSISFLGAILSSLEILSELGHPVTSRAAANMCLHNSEDVQLLDLRSVVSSTTRSTKSGRDWMKIRQQLLWLHNWQAGETQTKRSYHGLFWRVPRDIVETEILKALLEVKEYKLAVSIYTDLRTPLQASQVEVAVKDATTTAYDNASNGNRTRGGMKKAYDILQTFQSHFPDSVSFKQIQALISATHALSFYSLTLQHGVPFQPVSIRVHQDPLSLIEKVLDQNTKGYTNLDDLLSIGRNLVAAGFPPTPSDSDSYEHTPISEEDAPIIAERRVISLAISSALASDDLGTAYSYIFTRLATQTPSSTSIKDDISWRAVYNAGRYRSPATSSPPSLQSQINQLSQRMELLSLALVLVPYADPLPEILGAWRRCDEEMSVLRSQESEEEEIWDTKGDTVSMVPGGFGPSESEQDALETKQQHARRARAHQQQQQQNRSHEEAPMGLFEVARGAAMALHKNTLPLRGMAAAGTSTSRPAGHDWVDGDDDREADSEDRMRKRDVVSNMVTGGLASGIGWVLGAQPVNR
ncbi:secretory pathway Sec39 family protein [Aspergillus ruber CBS 135680]|uniref:Secretory pathway Sec39 n=1 Tax=Aspergillus ruber (strain CBS 135680) TaxID=1388766 RepID=A0A017SBL7_ASPRC|nr:secretory pathway Sec39 [Aspergillus ruber CBS 135680]EYE94342.1 secretory pathway Sec39 [Aspergillus ruber CBS 135680]